MVSPLVSYDAIIIGGGLGGLGAAAVLATRGKKILLLEKNTFLGGRCSSYKKQGFTIDYGTHIISRCEFGPIGKVSNLLQEHIKFYHLKRLPFYFLTSNKRYGPFGIDIDEKYGSILPPDEEFQELNLKKQDFKDLLTKFSSLISGMTLEKTHEYDHLSFTEYYDQYRNELNLGDGIENLVLALFGSGLCLMPEDGSAGEFLRTFLMNSNAMFKSMMSKNIRALGFGYPYGGCQGIPDAIERGLKKFGCVIRKSTRVAEIISKDGAVKGVQTNDGERFESKVIISNVGPKETLNLVGPEHFDKNYRITVQNLKPSIRPFVLKIALDQRITDEAFFFAISRNLKDSFKAFREGRLQQIPGSLFIPIVSNMDPTLAPKGKQLLIPGNGSPTEDVQFSWEKFEDKMLEWMEILFPHIQRHVLFYDVFKPQDCMSLFGSVDGSLLRVGQWPSQVGKNAFPSESPLKGLYLVNAGIGTDISGIGIEYALESGMKCTETLIKKKVV